MTELELALALKRNFNEKVELCAPIPQPTVEDWQTVIRNSLKMNEQYLINKNTPETTAHAIIKLLINIILTDKKEV